MLQTIQKRHIVLEYITNPPSSATASGPGPTPQSLQKARAVFRAAMRALVHFQASMLTRLAAALLRPDAAAHSNVHGPALPLPGVAADSGGLPPESAVVASGVGGSLAD